jgi:hypothetical protein
MESSTTQVNLWVLRNFFAIYLDRARELAKDGKKDEARDWLRFFRNSGILNVLSDGTRGVLSRAEESLYRKNLEKLESECHPLDVPDFRTDLQAIRADLSEIKNHLRLHNEPSLKVVSN